MDIIASYVVEHFKVHGENNSKTEVILHELSSRTGLNGGRMIDLTRKANGSYATDGLSRFLPFQRRSVPAVLPPAAQPKQLCAWCCCALDVTPKYLIGPYRVLEVLSCCVRTAHKNCIRHAIYRNGSFSCLCCGCRAYYPTLNPFQDDWSWSGYILTELREVLDEIASNFRGLKMIPLNDQCTVIVNKGKNEKPYTFIQWKSGRRTVLFTYWKKNGRN